ncbi:MAG: hypothetical protein HY814_08715 [Candidatus Riflebacteria bacterium]|nr:hypothetical protein [Candidatus Riflebacteria bacterium]
MSASRTLTILLSVLLLSLAAAVAAPPRSPLTTSAVEVSPRSTGTATPPSSPTTASVTPITAAPSTATATSMAVSSATSPAAQAPLDQESQDCLACHGEPSLTTERNGDTVSLHVVEEQFGKSIHAAVGCVGCHADLQGGKKDHPGSVDRVSCAACHDEQEKKYTASLHGKALARGDKLAPGCASCHGNHDIVPVDSPTSAVAPQRIPFVCGSCHQEGSPVQKQREIHQSRILQNYSESIHGEGLLRKGLKVAAQCASCHTAHSILPHTDPRSSIAKANVAKTCEQCHSQIESTHRKVIDGKLWQGKPDVIPVCVECHQPHKARKVFYDQGMADRDCLRCHATPVESGGRKLIVNHAELQDSMHRRIACAQCHTGLTPSNLRPCVTVTKKVDCAICHSLQVDEFKASIHGKLLAKSNPNAPSCVECHGTHGVLGKTQAQSPTFPTRVPALCARCHREGEKATRQYKGTEHDITSHYVESIHGKGLLSSGLVVTAMCSSCHTAHGALPASDPASTVSTDKVAQTCARCHHGVYEKYMASVHGPRPGDKPDRVKPVCSTCHSAHTIKRTDFGNFKLEIMARCGQCHRDVAATYFDTYHGKVSKLGYAKTAKCHDCHGSHNVLPVGDPRSTLSHNHIVDTCRKCHEGATRQFAGYLTHSTHHDPHKYPLVFWTFWSMTGLLVGTFTVFGLHTLLWLPRALEARRRRPPGGHDPSAPQVVRFRPLERALHATMIVSFITLAFTGMMLKFSYTGWAATVARFLGGFESAGLIHRAAALLMFALFATHLWDVLRNKLPAAGGLRSLLFGPDTMLFTLRDAKEAVATVLWYVGQGPRPSYGRWTYWEKFDYFAVFWGIAIIGSTGLSLWFPEAVTLLLPGWILNVATIIHSDEALLAVGFIFTIHFFNTHFRPDKFPMDMVIFTGSVPAEELEHDRPDEYRDLQASGGLQSRLGPPPSPQFVFWARVFGTVALLAGLSLVVGIVSAMVFAYK